jgi:hypothetical protein
MSEGIFRKFAPIAWDKGLPVVPIPRKGKGSISGWNKFANQIPDLGVRKYLMEKYPNCGIGLITGMHVGGGFRVAAFDLDMHEYLGFFHRLGKKLVSGKVGAKGETWFFITKDGKYRAINVGKGARAADVLLDGKLCILDPSIHPGTGLPYRPLGTSLLELEDLLTLPEFTEEELQVIEAILTFQDHTIIMSGEGTNDAAYRLMYKLAHITEDEDLACKYVTALYEPDYSGDEIEKLPRMFQSAREAMKQDMAIDMTGKKAKKVTPADLLINAVFAAEDIYLFHDDRQQPFISFQPEGKGKFVYPARSGSAKQRLMGLYYGRFGRAIPGKDLTDALDTICAKAVHDSAEHDVFLRLAGLEGQVIVDLANADGEVVIIDQEGFRVTTDSPVMFARVEGLKPLPVPSSEPGDAFLDLQRLLRLSDEALYRVVAYMICCLRPKGPYLLLLLEGEAGTGKSFLSEVIKSIIDPGFAPKLRLPDSERDLMIMAKNIFLLVFDNLSSMRGSMSDAICSLATNGGFATRKMYQDEGLQFFYQARPVLGNGIAGIADRPDLLERSLSLKLEVMEEGKRKTEEEMRDLLDELRPRIQGKLYQAVSQILKTAGCPSGPNPIRMADAAKWLVASEPATGFPEGTLLRSLQASQNEIIAERMDSNSVAIALHRLVDGSPFCGTVGKLLSVLKVEEDVRYDRYFPQTAASLSRELHKLRAALEKAGIVVEFGKKGREGRDISIWLADQAENREKALKMMAEVDAKRKF